MDESTCYHTLTLSKVHLSFSIDPQHWKVSLKHKIESTYLYISSFTKVLQTCCLPTGNVSLNTNLKIDTVIQIQCLVSLYRNENEHRYWLIRHVSTQCKSLHEVSRTCAEELDIFNQPSMVIPLGHTTTLWRLTWIHEVTSTMFSFVCL